MLNYYNYWQQVTVLSPSIRHTLYEIRSTKDYVRNYKPFFTKRTQIPKSQVNVNKVITKGYDKMDTWSIRKNEPKTNPNEPKTNPIKAQKMPKQTQNEPKQTQFQRPKI